MTSIPDPDLQRPRATGHKCRRMRPAHRAYSIIAASRCLRGGQRRRSDPNAVSRRHVQYRPPKRSRVAQPSRVNAQTPAIVSQTRCMGTDRTAGIDPGRIASGPCRRPGLAPASSTAVASRFTNRSRPRITPSTVLKRPIRNPPPSPSAESTTPFAPSDAALRRVLAPIRIPARIASLRLTSTAHDPVCASGAGSRNRAADDPAGARPKICAHSG